MGMLENILVQSGVVLDWMLGHLLLIDCIFAIIIVFFERRDPRTVWAWLLLMYFVPLAGFVLYLFLGQNMRKRKMFQTKSIEDTLNSQIQKQEENIVRNEFQISDSLLEEYHDLILYNLEASQAFYTQDNEVSIYTDGNMKFDELIKEIDRAQEYIHIQYYIIKQDPLFERIVRHLEKKVAQGVKVRILYDAMGGRFVRASYWKRLRAKGIQTAEFFPALFGRFHLRMNYRNHRKIVVIDGKIGFVGGFNIGKEYIGLDKRFGYWRDTHLKIKGSAVTDLHIRFILDWNYAAKEDLFASESFLKKPEQEFAGNIGVQIISNGPDSKYQSIRDTYLRMMSKAKKSIYIQTPYFIPDEAMMSVLRIAAVSGLDVKVMIPCKPDHPFVYWATYSCVGDLLDAGVKCYTYENGFLHAKGIMVDGLIASYGTANMDMRSFYLNFEVNAVIYDSETTRQLENIFMRDIGKSTEITRYDYNKRGLLIRIKEQVCRLLSPVM